MKKYLTISVIFIIMSALVSCGPEEDCREADSSKPGYKCDQKSGFWEKLKNGETDTQNGGGNSVDNGVCSYGMYKCEDDTQYFCGYSGDDLMWIGSTSTVNGNMWSSLSFSTMDWYRAVSYCDNLTECGYSDWHLPTISELRTLIKNCSGTVTGGSCGVTDSCLSSGCWDEDSCDSCSYDDSGKYSKLGDTGWLWSSSVLSDNSESRWGVFFDNGHVGNGDIDYNYYVRCVR